jgi:hypothetical protein
VQRRSYVSFEDTMWKLLSEVLYYMDVQVVDPQSFLLDVGMCEAALQHDRGERQGRTNVSIGVLDPQFSDSALGLRTSAAI